MMIRGPLTLLLLLVGLTVLIYVGTEFIAQQYDPIHTSEEELIQNSLNEALLIFDDVHDRFIEESNYVSERIAGSIDEGLSPQLIYDEFQNYSFWGISLYRNQELFVWDGFSLPELHQFQDTTNDSVQVSVLRFQNVVYLLGYTRFTFGDDETFDLFTTQKLQQKNNIPVVEGQEFDLANHTSLNRLYPVQFTFFDSVSVPASQYRTLRTLNSDSVGVVFAETGELTTMSDEYQSRVSRWRTVFYILFFLLGVTAFFIWSFTLPSWHSMAVQLSGIFLIWTFFTFFDLPSQWITYFHPTTGAETTTSLTAISYYTIDALFMFFISLSIITTLTKKWRQQTGENHFQTFIVSALLGSLSTGLILFFIVSTSQTADVANIPLMDLELIPGTKTWFFFISTGFFMSSITALLIGTWWFLFVSEQDKPVVISVLGLVGFIVTYFFADLFLSASLFTGWEFFLGFGLFAVILSTALFIFTYPRIFLEISGFRLLLFGALLSTTTGYTIYIHSYYEQMDRQLTETAENFIQEENGDARKIFFGLLSSIEERTGPVSEIDISESTSTIQTRFQRAIEMSMNDETNRFSFDIQLVTPDGNVISDYATNFDSPYGYYNMFSIQVAYEGERIRRITNRPIIHSRPPTLAGNQYSTFLRGWIPIYSNTEPYPITAWIISAIYTERPDFNKPIRAVLSAYTSDDWKSSFYVSEFIHGAHTRSMVKGIYENQPTYSRLPQQEMEIAAEDSMAFLSNYTAEGHFRELLYSSTDSTVVMASTPIPEFNHHLFSFFRMNVILVIAGLILFPLFSMLGLNIFNLFSQSRKFQHRLLDGLSIATLLFLVVLVVTTQYAVKNQNESELQREIIGKLDNLNETIQLERQQNITTESGIIPLTRATSPLDADAIFYNGFLQTASTTPQIFQQNLLPRTLPYPVYDSLFNRRRNHTVTTINIGDETLLIGYRILESDDNEPIGAIAIPTFLQSPIYTEQLLETTSYLLVLYLLMFGVFIISTFFISRQLTKPLQYIQSGLNKISSGDLETSIPVKSRDEIGSLSSAYNTMVKRLKELQLNLAEAEREAAWKEMAQQVAHEIRNPLTPMKLNLQHLQRQIEMEPHEIGKLRKKINQVTEQIIEQIDSLNNIASDFSRFGKPVRGEFAKIDVNHLIESLTEFYQPDTKGTIRLDLYPANLHVHGAEQELRRTLINLVKNSFEAFEESGELVIRTYRRKNTVFIELKDNGVGIAEEDRDRIFVPNFSTKSSGTGLGLAISKQTIEAHHGRIYFESDVGEGTTFIIEIPLLSLNEKE